MLSPGVRAGRDRGLRQPETDAGHGAPADLCAERGTAELTLHERPGIAFGIRLGQHLDDADRAVLRCIIEKFDGGPVGIESLAAAIGEERGTLEDVIEPFLIQQGFLMRTARGRIATRAAYLHFGLKVPERALTNMPLFEGPN